MTHTAQRHIDWDSAQVHDRRLEVRLEGDGTKEWDRHFNAVLAHLHRDNGPWGNVKLTKRQIKVADVQDGAEDDVRHFLESVVLQANTDLAPQLDPPVADEPRAADSVDERMTRAFRAFAPAD